jgi:hypothetical protein
MSFDLGAVVPLGTTVRDAAGALANAGAMALTVTLPDQTTVAVAPVAPTATGVYAYDYPTVQPGRHVVRWVASGVNAGAYTDSFDVREAAPPGILSLSDAKAHLNIVSSAHDDELRGWIEAVTAAVEVFTGPVVVRTVVEDHDVRAARTLALRQPPVLSLTSVAPILTGGITYTVGEFSLDGGSGIVQLLAGGTVAGPLRVTYVAGRRIVPAAITAAAKIILQHLWRTQQGPGRPQRGVDDFDVTEPIPGLGYAIPNRAVQLLEPYKQPPGVA